MDRNPDRSAPEAVDIPPSSGSSHGQENDPNLWIQRPPGVERALAALAHFKNVIAPEGDLIDDWENLDEDTRSWYCAEILRELFDDGYRDLEERLGEQPQVAGAAGLSSINPPHYSTLSRQIGKLDENILEQAAQWAGDAALHQLLSRGKSPNLLGPNPSKPRFYYEIVDEEWSVGWTRKCTKQPVSSGSIWH